MTPDTEKQSFVTEKIKDKPFNKKRLLTKVGTAALCGLVFALFTMCGMALGMPLIARYLRDEASMIEDTEANLSVNTEYLTEFSEETESSEANTQPETESEEAVSEAAEQVVVELALEDYTGLREELCAIGKEAEKSIVTISSITDETDWLNSSYRTTGVGCGVIISETDSSYLIMTEKTVIEDGSRILVSMSGGMQCEAVVIAEDANLGLSIISIAKSDLEPGYLGRLAIAGIGNSKACRAGDIVLALGRPLGSGQSMLIGSIVATDGEVAYQDGNYRYLLTDLPRAGKGSGILINLSGEVIGLVRPDKAAGSEVTLSALAVNDVEGILRLLINGNLIPYAGLYLSDVTRLIQEEYQIPAGVYIREVTVDSPAMLAGLQSGDVITEVAGIPVMTNMAFQTQLLTFKPEDICPITVQRPGPEGYDEIICELTVGCMGR